METKEIEIKSTEAMEKATAFNIINAETYVAANEYLKDIKGLSKQVEDSFNPIIEKAHAAHKEAIAQKKKHLDPLEQAIKLLKSKVGTYIEMRENERREKEAELAQEAERKEAKIREQARVKQEAAEKLRREAEEAALEDEKAAAKLREKALKAEQKAERLEEKADSVEVVKLESVINAVKGISHKTVWDFEITHSNLIPRQFLMIDEKAIRAYVKATKGKQEIIGIRIFSRQETAVRG